MQQKNKILMISDHALSYSGVGTQSRFLILGLINTGKYSFKQLGGALKHANDNVIKVNDDFIVKPVDGFGTPELIRFVIAKEKPDCLLLFTDPRFFSHIIMIEDEIHDVCPIAYWHLWDGQPYPSFNAPFYESVDLINCINWTTHCMVKERYPEKTHYVPHAVPQSFYNPLSSEDRVRARRTLFGNQSEGWFIGLWTNRNARRKRPNDVLVSWALFLRELELRHGRPARDLAKLVLHTDQCDPEGIDMPHVAETLGISDSVVFSAQRVEFDKMTMLYNAVDFSLNISHSEGFGLPTLETMMCGTPIVAVKTGGLTRQVVGREGENGVALPVELRTYVGSLQVPHITEDYVSCETVAAGIMKLYEIGPEARRELGQRALRHARENYDIEDMVRKWDQTLEDLIIRWRTDRRSVHKPWSMTQL